VDDRGSGQGEVGAGVAMPMTATEEENKEITAGVTGSCRSSTAAVALTMDGGPRRRVGRRMKM